MLLVLAFVATFAAGVATGFLASRTRRRPRGPSWLASELNLTNEQRDQMHRIWSEAMRAAGSERWEQRKSLVRERDDAIAALLTDEQQPPYNRILQDYEDKKAAMEGERKKRFEQAVEQTKQILTPEQAAKYEQLLKDPPDRGHGDRHRPPPPWGGPPRSPSESVGKNHDEPVPPHREE